MQRNNKFSLSLESHTKKKIGFNYLRPIDRSFDNSRNSQLFTESRHISIDDPNQFRPPLQLIRLRMTLLRRPRDSVSQIRLEKLVNEQLKSQIKTRNKKLEEIDKINLFQNKSTIQTNVTDAYKQVKKFSENMSFNVCVVRRMSRQERFQSIMNNSISQDLKDIKLMVEKNERDRVKKQFRIQCLQKQKKRQVTFVS